MIMKKYVTVAGQLKTLITIQKFKKLAIKYLMLLYWLKRLVMMQNLKKPNIIQLVLLIQLKNADYDKKLLNDRVNSNKTKQIEVDRKLTDHINSSTKLIKDLAKKVKLISTK